MQRQQVQVGQLRPEPAPQAPARCPPRAAAAEPPPVQSQPPAEAAGPGRTDTTRQPMRPPARRTRGASHHPVGTTTRPWSGAQPVNRPDLNATTRAPAAATVPTAASTAATTVTRLPIRSTYPPDRGCTEPGARHTQTRKVRTAAVVRVVGLRVGGDDTGGRPEPEQTQPGQQTQRDRLRGAPGQRRSAAAGRLRHRRRQRRRRRVRHRRAEPAVERDTPAEHPRPDTATRTGTTNSTTAATSSRPSATPSTRGRELTDAPSHTPPSAAGT